MNTIFFNFGAFYQRQRPLGRIFLILGLVALPVLLILLATPAMTWRGFGWSVFIIALALALALIEAPWVRRVLMIVAIIILIVLVWKPLLRPAGQWIAGVFSPRESSGESLGEPEEPEETQEPEVEEPEVQEPEETEEPEAEDTFVYALKGLEYEACVWQEDQCIGWDTTNDIGDPYNAVWTQDGRLWQPALPTEPERAQISGFEISIVIAAGDYDFDGVRCILIDEDGSVLGDHQNQSTEPGAGFTLLEETNAKVSCDAFAHNTGFNIQYLSPAQ